MYQIAQPFLSHYTVYTLEILAVNLLIIKRLLDFEPMVTQLNEIKKTMRIY